MPNSPILFEVVVVFGAALAVIALSHRLRIPAVVGFLLTGILIGPHGLRLVPDTRHVEAFAELAVALMLFVFTSIGMILSLSVFVANLGWILVATIGILTAKAGIVWLVAQILRFPLRTAVA